MSAQDDQLIAAVASHFRSVLQGYLGDPITPETVERMRENIKDTIEQLMPHQNVQVELYEVSPDQFRATITYTPPSIDCTFVL